MMISMYWLAEKRLTMIEEMTWVTINPLLVHTAWITFEERVEQAVFPESLRTRGRKT
jgi:hypothetical protein